MLCANWSVQVGLRKLLYASCTVQVALRKLLRASCSGKLVPASGSLQVALCKLRSLQVALCKLLVQAALCKLLCVSCSAQVALGKALCANWSVQVSLLCATCSAQVAVKCKLHFATPARGPGRNRRSRRANHERTLEDQFEQQKSQKTSSFCTSTTPIPAEGCASTAEIAKNLEFLHLDHADPRRGLREHVGNRKKPWVFAPRPRRSPQRVDFRVVSSALPRRPKKRF